MEEGLAKGASVPDLHLQVIREAQYEIGAMWERDEISVAKEHAASAIAQLALSRLYPHLPRATHSGQSAVVACVPGEQHDLAARIASDFMEMAGFDVRFLGADAPLESTLDLVEETSATVLALSITMPMHVNALERSVSAARARFGPDLQIIVGGRAAEPITERLMELGATAVGTDAMDMAQRALQATKRAH